MADLSRFKFIGHALEGDGPFRPTVTTDGSGTVSLASPTYLVKYPRESDEKFARRNELAFYAAPMARVVSKFVAHIATKPIQRDIKSELLKLICDDTDGKGNNIEVFWRGFMKQAKARGSMLLLVDAPSSVPDTMQTQLSERLVPYWSAIAPESLSEWKLGDDGKFDYVEYPATYTDSKGEEKDCFWYFNRIKWEQRDKEKKIISEGDHGFGKCPMLIFSESGTFPHYGPFAPIADLSKRLFNVDSELDEILRAQTFSLLTMQVPENTSSVDQIEAAKTAGTTIGTSNLLTHMGTSPSFIAPPDGPASIYMQRKDGLRAEISEIGMEITETAAAESGESKKWRFQALNAELAMFADSMSDFEKQAWELTAMWLNLGEEPEIAWPLDYQLADPEQELEILRQMQETGMNPDVIMAQKERVIVSQFSSSDQGKQDDLIASLSADASENTGTDDD